MLHEKTENNNFRNNYFSNYCNLSAIQLLLIHISEATDQSRNRFDSRRKMEQVSGKFQIDKSEYNVRRKSFHKYSTDIPDEEQKGYMQLCLRPRNDDTFYQKHFEHTF